MSSQAVVLMNGYIVSLDSITDHSVFNPETTPIIFDVYTGRVRQFTKGNSTYLAVVDIKTDKFKHYVNAQTFWNNATPTAETYIGDSLSSYNTEVYKYAAIPFLFDVMDMYGPGVKEGKGVPNGTKVILAREKIFYDSNNEAYVRVEKRGFDFYENKSCSFEGETITGNMCADEVFDNIQNLSGYIEYPVITINIQNNSLKLYSENIKNKKFKNEATGLFYFNDYDHKPIIDEINYLFFKILNNQALVSYLQTNNLFVLFQKHFDIINEHDGSSALPGGAQKFYHKRYTERYFNLLYSRLIEFYFWSTGVTISNIDKTEVLIRLISLFTDIEISELTYNYKITLLEEILKGNYWISGKWNPFYSGTKLSEEEVIVKLIRAFYREDNNGNPVYNEIDDFLDYLNDSPKYEVSTTVSLYQLLYNKINDDILFGDTGQGARGQYVRSIFDLWTLSKYNPSPDNENPLATTALDNFTYTPYRAASRPIGHPEAAPAMINYESTKAAIWYLDNYDFEFENNRIKATERDPGVHLGAVVGYYQIYQPVSIKQTNADDTIVRMPKIGADVKNGIPIFYLMYVDDAGDYSDAKATIGFATDVILTFTGIGEVKNIKYLKEVTNFRKYISGSLSATEKAVFLERISSALSGANSIMGAASLTLSFTTTDCTVYLDPASNPPNPNDPDYIEYKFCQAADGFLFALEMFTLSADLLARRALKRATRKFAQNIPPGSQYNDLRNAVHNIDDLAQDLSNFLADLQQTHPNVHSKVDAFVNEEEKFAFMFDFQNYTSLLNELNVEDDLIDIWVNINASVKRYRNSVRLLKARRFLSSATNNKFRAHIFEGEVKFYTTNVSTGGLHHIFGEGVIQNSYGKIVNVISTDHRGYSSTHVEILHGGNFYKKGDYVDNVFQNYVDNDMFRQDWTQEELLDNIALAYTTKYFSGTKNRYYGQMSDAKIIVICIKGGNSNLNVDFVNEIITAWPKNN